MLVWLASYPRSGNTFFRVLLKHLYDTNTFSVYGDPDIVAMGADQAVGHDVLPAPIDELKKSKELYVVKTHELPSDDAPAIYLVRDGRDAVVSHARYRLSFVPERGLPEDPTFENVLRDIITNEDHYGGWGRHVLEWTGRPNVSVVRFEELVADPMGTITRAVDGLPFERTENDVPSFDELHEKWPKFFRKGQVGGWQQEMSWRLHRLFWKHHGDAMRRLAYPRKPLARAG